MQGMLTSTRLISAAAAVLSPEDRRPLLALLPLSLLQSAVKLIKIGAEEWPAGWVGGGGGV